MLLGSSKTNVEKFVFPISGPLENCTVNTGIFKDSEKKIPSKTFILNDELPRLSKCIFLKKVQAFITVTKFLRKPTHNKEKCILSCWSMIIQPSLACSEAEHLDKMAWCCRADHCMVSRKPEREEGRVRVPLTLQRHRPRGLTSFQEALLHKCFVSLNIVMI